MIWLAKLIRDIDSFYKKAMNLSKIAISPEDAIALKEREIRERLLKQREEKQKAKQRELEKSQPLKLYLELVDIVNSGVETGKINTQDIDVDDLLLIAEEYKEAIKLDAGFATVYQHIRIFLKNNDVIGDEPDEDEDSENVFGSENKLEDILNAIIKDLKDRAGGADLTKIKDSDEVREQIKAARDRKTQELYEEAGTSALEQGQSGIGGPTYNPYRETGGEDGPKFRSGFHEEDVKTYKNWSKSFKDEAEYYKTTLSEDASEDIHNNTIQLIEILNHLAPLATKLEQANQQLLTVPDDKDAALDVRILKEKIKPLIETRIKLKAKIRNYFREKDAKNYKDQLNDPEKSIIEKLILSQKAALSELSASRDINKQKEKVLRQNLLAILEGKILKNVNGKMRRVAVPGRLVGTLPSKELLQRYLDEIEAAKAERIPIAKAEQEKWKARVEKRLQGDIAELLRQLGQAFANVKMGIKKDLTFKMTIERIKRENHGEFQPLINSLAKAAGNQEMERKIIAGIRKKAERFAKEQGWLAVFNAEAQNSPIIIEWEANKPLYDAYRAEVKELDEYLKRPEADRKAAIQQIEKLIFTGKQLVAQNFTRYDSPNNVVMQIVNSLQKILGEIINE